MDCDAVRYRFDERFSALISYDLYIPVVGIEVSVSVDSVIAVIIAEYVCRVLISALVPDSADIEALVGCGACYADSGVGVGIVVDFGDAL